MSVLSASDATILFNKRGSAMNTSTQQLAARAMTIGQCLSTWASERDQLNSTAVAQPLTEDQRKRLADLNSSIDTYEELMCDVPVLPKHPWIARALKAA
jgi:hypothetical protein